MTSLILVYNLLLISGDATHYPRNGQTCRVHYDAFLSSDGSKFDSSRARNLPFEFVLGEGQVILGWDKSIGKLSLVSISLTLFTLQLHTPVNMLPHLT